MLTLKDRLKNWQDWDVAAYELATVLGLVPEFTSPQPPPPTDGWHGFKWIFWSNNRLGNALYETLNTMIEAGVLEREVAMDRVRWNQSYQPESKG